ncbi:tRNA-guanine family transglycosylase [Halogeometricum limi]|uniref:tRNA-guanine family transglycosylase n=2 Tax=Halogeometricum limi TaxID=555875 RepID=A0A1I6HV60_9EURY|nr:tRNA-guanine family transglycosylase [Halogeometricum limi]
MKQLSKEGVNVMFDSGGYHVQTNNGDFDELYNYIMPFYDKNRWAHQYVLPDNVPLSDDDDETVERKVKETRTNAKLSYHFLPEELKSRAVPVIQGSKYPHITDCIDTYSELDQIQTVGFGSFETFGKNNGINFISERVAETLRYAVNLAHERGLKIHAFGVGGPTAIPVLGKLGVDSFDCSSWLRAAGYGDIYFPFRTPRNVTHKTDRTGPKVFRSDLEELKKETGHKCPFCASYDKLRDSRIIRILHNLIVLRDMAESINSYSTEEMLDLMNDKSRYTTILRSIS